MRYLRLREPYMKKIMVYCQLPFASTAATAPQPTSVDSNFPRKITLIIQRRRAENVNNSKGLFGAINHRAILKLRGGTFFQKKIRHFENICSPNDQFFFGAKPHLIDAKLSSCSPQHLCPLCGRSSVIL